MQETTILFRMLPYVSYVVSIIGALIAGTLVYNGLATKLERRHFRLRLISGWQDSKKEYMEATKKSKLEKILKEASYPLGLNAVLVNTIFAVLFLLLALNYVLYPLLISGEIYFRFFVGILVIVLLYPSIPYTPANFILKKLIEYRKAKLNAELFSLYDMIVSEIQMMQSTRINMYSLLNSLTPFFKELGPSLTTLIVEHNSIGTNKAVDNFVETIGTNEAASLGTVLKTFDEAGRETLIKSLKGMEELFIVSQVENNRRKRKTALDLASIPITAANYIIILNFIIVFVMMALALIDNSDIGI